jgi:DNA-directed RNA polymerase specialized sigma24 family protein
MPASHAPSSPPPPAPDAFPATQYTLIGRLLGDRERGMIAAAQHVMTVYAGPLKVYYTGSSFRTLGDADDIVQGFFASRLSRENFMHDWLNSRRQLRFWLMTAFKHFLFEQARARKCDRERMASDEGIDVRCDQDDELTLVRQAMQSAEEACRAAGQEDHWRVFVRHHVDGRSYEQLQDELGIDRKRFNVMARTAGNKLKSALRDLLAWPDASEEDIDAELRDLMEVIQ